MKIIGATYDNDILVVICYCFDNIVAIDYENNCATYYNDILVIISYCFNNVVAIYYENNW